MPLTYPLGPGDELWIQYYGKRSDRFSVVVNRRGEVDIPEVGRIAVAGLTLQQARALLAETIQKKLLGVSVSITMGALRRIHVLLVGDVRRPGILWVYPLTTAFEALWQAGGVRKSGSLRRIEIHRNGHVLRRLDAYRLLLAGKATEDVRLAPRDVLFVPPLGKTVAVVGAVVRPAIYELRRERTVADVVRLAGGRASDAALSRVFVSRLMPTGDERLLEVRWSEASHTRIQEGDIVFVPRHPEAGGMYVAVWGEVKAPGRRAWKKDLRLGDVLALQDFLPSALRTRVEIIRHEVQEGQKRTVRRLDVMLDAQGKWKELALLPFDVVLVRRMEGWRPDAVVHLKGEFRFPGDYPIEEGERLSSVIARAGGFTDEAYLPAAIFLRESIKKQQEKELVRMRAEMQAAISRKEAQLAGVSGKEAEQTRQALEAARRVLAQLESLKATGRMVIRLADAEKLKGTPFDLRLQDGDTLIVPKRPDHVLVLGEVFSPNAQIYQPGKGWRFYVEHAGGFTRFADEDHVYVVHANGEVEPAGGWKHVRIGPGDAIVVPQDLAPFNLLGAMLDWSKVFYQIGVTLASMRAIGII